MWLLVDASGQPAAGPKTPDAVRLSAEQALEDKLVSTLEPVTGAGNVRASVTLDYDETATEETAELTIPTDGDARHAAHGPDHRSAAGSRRSSRHCVGMRPTRRHCRFIRTRQRRPRPQKSESSTYGVSKTVRHTVDNPGRVRRLTAANRGERPSDAAGNEEPCSRLAAALADELRNLTTLAQAAVGFDTSRGDVVTVEDLAFDGNQGQPPVALPEQILNTAGELAGAGEVSRAAGRFDGGSGLRRAARDPSRRHGAGDASAGQIAFAGAGGGGRIAGDAERSRARADRSRAAAQSGDLRAGERPPQARAHAELAAVAELDSLGLGRVGTRRPVEETGREFRLAEMGIESEATRHRPGANISGVRKAAILLVAVGEELAKEVLRALPETDVQQITEELADLRGITPELSAQVLEEFWQLLDTQNFMVHGGLDYANRVLIEAFGKQRATICWR